MAQAALRKYPNPMNTNVRGTDVIDRQVIDGVLHTHRLVTSDFGFPKWAQAVRFVYFSLIFFVKIILFIDLFINFVSVKIGIS